MARGVNKVILVGSLGQDPETRFMTNGNPVCNISIATNEKWKDKNSGEMVEKTEWHKVVFFGKLAEIVEKYLKKGSQVYIEGKLETKKWEKDGVTHYTTSIKAHEMQMLGGKGSGESNNQSTQQQPQQQPQQQQSMDDFDGDIPF